MSISKHQYLEMLARTQPKHRQGASEDAVPAGTEAKLQNEIVEYCGQQWPRWVVVRSRMDRATTTAKGICDLIIFAPKQQCLLVEAKTKTGKLSEDQLCWAAEMRQLGWTVNVCRSMTDFYDVVAKAKGIVLP